MIGEQGAFEFRDESEEIDEYYRQQTVRVKEQILANFHRHQEEHKRDLLNRQQTAAQELQEKLRQGKKQKGQRHARKRHQQHRPRENDKQEDITDSDSCDGGEEKEAPLRSDYEMPPAHTTLMRQLSDFRRAGGVSDSQADALKAMLRSRLPVEQKQAMSNISDLLSRPVNLSSPVAQVPEMPTLLRQLSVERREGGISEHDASRIKDNLFSKNFLHVKEARETIEELSKRRYQLQQAQKALERHHQDDILPNKPEWQLSAQDKLEARRWQQEQQINMLVDRKSNVYLSRDIWHMVFEFLPASTLLGCVACVSKFLHSFVDNRILGIVVNREMRDKGLPPLDTSNPEWRNFYRDGVMKWERTKQPEGFKIKVYCRFFTGVNGEKYVPRKSPAYLESIAREKWKEKEQERMYKRKENRIKEQEFKKQTRIYERALREACAKYRRPAAIESVAYLKPREPDYGFVEDEKYEGVEQLPTVLSFEHDTVHCWLPNIGPRDFKVQGVYDSSYTQKQIYDRVAHRISQNAIYGYNGTLFCYGQTGSGKTWSMFGESLFRTTEDGRRVALGDPNPANYGFVPRACQHILESLEMDRTCDWTFSVAYTEFYQNKLTDLTTGLEVRLQEDGNAWKVTSQPTQIRSMRDVFDVLRVGDKQKHVFSTAMNARSSRAHTVFTIFLHQSSRVKKKILESTYHLVDLAGSERIKKSKAAGQRLEEAKQINQSLSTLERCILKLSELAVEKAKRKKSASSKRKKDTTHVPFRDCELTKLLQESLGGNSQTTMLITCSGDIKHAPESISTLRFGERAAKIKNTVKQSDLVGEIKESIQKLEKQNRKIGKGFLQFELDDGDRLHRMKQEMEEVLIQEKKARELRREQGIELKYDPNAPPPYIVQLTNRYNQLASRYSRQQLRDFQIIKHNEYEIEELNIKLQGM